MLSLLKRNSLFSKEEANILEYLMSKEKDDIVLGIKMMIDHIPRKSWGKISESAKSNPYFIDGSPIIIFHKDGWFLLQKEFYAFGPKEVIPFVGDIFYLD